MSNIMWFRISDEPPPTDTTLLVLGLSGYTSIPRFICLAHYRSPRMWKGQDPRTVRWVDEANDALSDRGRFPTHYSYAVNGVLPTLEEIRKSHEDG